jgi:uncharacterized protein (PEP-CTERM system associated)
LAKPRSIAAGLCLASLAGLTLDSAARAETQYSWQIAANGYWADNILLVDSGFGETSSLAFEIEPSLELIQDSDRIKSRLDYTFSYITYTESLEDDQAYHNLDAGTEIAVVPELVFLPANVGYTQALVDPTDVGSYGGGLFGAGNLSDVFTYRVSPRLESRGSRGSVLLEYTYGHVAYDAPELEDADDQGLAAILGIGDPEGSLAGRIGYLKQKSTFEGEDVEDYLFDTLFGELGFRVTKDLRLLGRGGLESDIEGLVADGGLDETFWAAGFEWRATQDDMFEAFIGERFYGTSYEARWVRTSRRFTLEAAYKEEPTTQSRLFSLRPFDVDSGTPQGAGVQGSQGYGRITNDAFLSKEFRASIALTGRLTTISLDARQEDREYFVNDLTDRIGEIGLSISRRLAPETTISIDANLARYELREGEEYDELGLSIRGSRVFSDSLTGEFELSHIERSGDLQNYDTNWVRVGVVKRFGGD